MLAYITKVFETMCRALQSVWGWLIAICSVVANYFAGNEFAVCAVLIVVVLDAVWGIWVALKQGKFAKSELIRNTIVKISAYGTALVILIAAEKLLHIESSLPVGIVSAVICLTELWSITGNILIINPHIAFFRLLRPALKGEIAHKLGISEDKVDEILDEKK